MAWGLEARVPFLDKEFIEASFNIDPQFKTFSKTGVQEVDAEGRPKIEKVCLFPLFPDRSNIRIIVVEVSRGKECSV